MVISTTPTGSGQSLAYKLSGTGDENILKRLTFGMLAHLGPGPTDEDIDEMRREALANFPREEFYD